MGATGCRNAAGRKTTVEVTQGRGFHLQAAAEAEVYNDLTRSDTSALFTAKGDDQQNAAEEFAPSATNCHDRITKARDPGLGCSQPRRAGLRKTELASSMSQRARS